MVQHAVVCYLDGDLAKFAEGLRSQLAPQQSHLRAHITLLPPRLIPPDNESGNGGAGKALRSAGLQLAPLRISLDQVESFLPLHPTVYLRVHHGARHLRSIYETLNTGDLAAADPWPYLPHLTLATLPDAGQARAALAQAQQHWQRYEGERELTLIEMTLVREDTPEHWTDLETILWGA